MHQTTLLNYLKEERPLTMSSTTMSMSKIWLVQKIILQVIVRLCYEHLNTAVLFLSFSLIDLILFVRLKRMHLLWPTLGP